MSPKCSIFLSKGMVPGLIKIGILGLVMVSNSAMDYTLRRNFTLTANKRGESRHKPIHLHLPFTFQWTTHTCTPCILFS